MVRKDRSSYVNKTYLLIMLPKFYQTHLKSQLSLAKYLLLKILRVVKRKAAGIPVYVKQLGTDWAKQSAMSRSDTKGANPQLWEEDLRIREFPGV